MKLTSTKKAPAAARKSSPFFQRESDSSFFANRSESFFNPGAVQTKLNIGATGDKYEREADNMADKVVRRMADNGQSLKPGSSGQHGQAPIITSAVQLKCAACEQEEQMQVKEKEELPNESGKRVSRFPLFENAKKDEMGKQDIQRKCAACAQEEKETVRRQTLTEVKLDQEQEKGPGKETKLSDKNLINPQLAGGGLNDSGALERRLQATRGGGNPLSPELGNAMGHAFGADFSNVRVHHDQSAAEMSEQLNAQAFTHGSDIYFNHGKYDTGSSEGKKLLAHELTHTVQQGAVPAGDIHSSGEQATADSGETSGQVQRAYLRDSTMEICHRVLKSKTFRSTNGSVIVKFRPRLSDPDNPDCQHHRYHVSLTYSVGPFTFETGPIHLHSSGPQWVGWMFVPDGDCYLTIWREYDNPYCCLMGDVVVTDTAAVDCEEKRHNREFPSQLGGHWDWNGTGLEGTYGPGPRLEGPFPNTVYVRDPGIPSGAKCRGACGPDCDTCKNYPEFTYYDPVSGQTWLYTNFEVCNSHDGCRQHDAGFDWAAAEHGEKGRRAPLMKWHMNANYECVCNYNLSQCAGWIRGNPPHSDKLYFADKAEQITSAMAAEECKAQNPDFTDCTDQGADRDEVLVLWGMENGYENFRDCSPHRTFPPGVIQACDLGPGRTWHCTATESDTGKDVTISIFECYCCKEDGSSGSDWRDPHLSIRVAYDIAASRGAPIIGQSAFNRAQTAINRNRYAEALEIVVRDLISGRRMNPSLFYIRYVNKNGEGEGLTNTDYHLDPASGNYVPDGPSEVEIYNPAFKNVQWLVSTVMHEYQHVLQGQRDLSKDEYEDKTGEYLEADEVEAYLWEIEHADETGMATRINDIRDTFDRLKDHYDTLGGINRNRQRVYRDRYLAARRFVRDLQESAPPMPGYVHVFHHGSDYDTVELLRTADITATGGVDFGRGFYVHTKDNWYLAREWAIRHSLGKKGWGVVTFPVPDKPWREEIHHQLVFRNTRSQPRNIPINPDTGKKFKDWKEFVDYNKRKGRQGALPDWSEFDAIEGPLWGRLSRRPNIHQVMFTGSGVGVLNRPDVKPLRFIRRWLFLRFR